MDGMICPEKTNGGKRELRCGNPGPTGFVGYDPHPAIKAPIAV
jgi:hypothetical protein